MFEREPRIQTLGKPFPPIMIPHITVRIEGEVADSDTRRPDLDNKTKRVALLDRQEVFSQG